MKAWRIGLGAIGVAGVLFGLRGLVLGGVATHWPVPAVWLVAGVLAHDLVLVPLVAAAGWVLARVVPARVRPVLRGGLLVAAAVTLVALPVLSGKGDATNASLTPLDYPRNLAIVLGAVAAGTAVLAVVRLSSGREA
ncbi:MAG TPA: hypothetical protein VLM05_14960 [Mycobacteriales bacterium]|nr:hypothetical protein [Mycobacteriales bacterium]